MILINYTLLIIFDFYPQLHFNFNHEVFHIFPLSTIIMTKAGLFNHFSIKLEY